MTDLFDKLTEAADLALDERERSEKLEGKSETESNRCSTAARFCKRAGVSKIT
jgi:hypothetical protein